MAFASCLIALAACQPARMAVLPRMAVDSTSWPVTERNYFLDESLSFGPYQVVDVHRSWTTIISWGASGWGVGYRDSEATQKYEFTLSRGGKKLSYVQCATDADWNQGELEGMLGRNSMFTWDLSSNASLVCSIVRIDGPAWKLMMRQTMPEMTLGGALSGGGRQINVIGARELAGTSWPAMEAAGYHFMFEGQAVGAVEVLNCGHVWVRNDEPAETQQALAEAATALLLYRELKR